MLEPLCIAILVREYRDALHRDRERIHGKISEMRDLVTRGHEMVGETQALIAVADAMAGACYGSPRSLTL